MRGDGLGNSESESLGVLSSVAGGVSCGRWGRSHEVQCHGRSGLQRSVVGRGGHAEANGYWEAKGGTQDFRVCLCFLYPVVPVCGALCQGTGQWVAVLVELP